MPPCTRGHDVLFLQHEILNSILRIHFDNQCQHKVYNENLFISHEIGQREASWHPLSNYVVMAHIRNPTSCFRIIVQLGTTINLFLYFVVVGFRMMVGTVNAMCFDLLLVWEIK